MTTKILKNKSSNLSAREKLMNEIQGIRAKQTTSETYDEIVPLFEELFCKFQHVVINGLPETKWTNFRNILAIIGGIAILIYISSL